MEMVRPAYYPPIKVFRLPFTREFPPPSRILKSSSMNFGLWLLREGGRSPKSTWTLESLEPPPTAPNLPASWPMPTKVALLASSSGGWIAWAGACGTWSRRRGSPGVGDRRHLCNGTPHGLHHPNGPPAPQHFRISGRIRKCCGAGGSTLDHPMEGRERPETADGANPEEARQSAWGKGC